MKREKIREKNKTNPRNHCDYRGFCGGEGGIRILNDAKNAVKYG